MSSFDRFDNVSSNSWAGSWKDSNDPFSQSHSYIDVTPKVSKKTKRVYRTVINTIGIIFLALFVLSGAWRVFL